MTDITIRQLTQDEWALFRDMRLMALQSDEQYFTDSYADASTWPDTAWQERMENAAIFVAFDGETPVGLGAITQEDRDTAEIWAGFVVPSHRKRGLQTRLLQARVDWARAQGIRNATVAHRDSNTISAQSLQSAGFAITHTKKSVRHGDGSTPKEFWYVLHLDSEEPQAEPSSNGGL